MSGEESRREITGLHVCPDCGCDSVYPFEWGQDGPDHWEVTLRCPNCEQWTTGRFSQESCELYDEMLDSQQMVIVQHLRQIERLNMSDDIERFAQALSTGLILPEDF